MPITTEKRRSLAMAVTYRVLSSILLACITYWVTGELVSSMVVTVTFAILATVLFYANDRAWEQTDWGKRPSNGLSKVSPPFPLRQGFQAVVRQEDWTE